MIDWKSTVQRTVTNQLQSLNCSRFLLLLHKWRNGCNSSLVSTLHLTVRLLSGVFTSGLLVLSQSSMTSSTQRSSSLTSTSSGFDRRSLPHALTSNGSLLIVCPLMDSQRSYPNRSSQSSSGDSSLRTSFVPDGERSS
jgi:hypothetical protein